jgi:hypothetical protein
VRTYIISPFEEDGSRIMRYRRSERSDVDEALLKWFKEPRSDNAPMSDPLLMIIF